MTGAPNADQRAIILAALRVYAELVWQRLPGAKLWINGGFVTHKSAAPKDVDVVVVAPAGTEYDLAEHPEDLPLWTMHRVSVAGLNVSALRMQPMGNLVDGFFVSEDQPAAVHTWRSFWQRLKVDGEPDRLDAKGFVEVVQ